MKLNSRLYSKANSSLVKFNNKLDKKVRKTNRCINRMNTIYKTLRFKLMKKKSNKI